MSGKHRPIDPKMLEILVAPGSHAPLRYDADAQELISDRDGLAFPIRDGIPILLLGEARQLGDAESPGKPPPPGARPTIGKSSP